MTNIYRLAIITVMLQFTLLVYAEYLKPLPVAGQPGKPVLVLTGAPLEKGVIPEPSTQLYGATVINKDAERIDVNDSKIILVRGGWGKSGVTLRYAIDMTTTPIGKYSFWTAYTLGGKSEQSITVRVGKDGNNLETRLSISQSNVESWKTTWQLAPGEIALKSTDTVLEIAISGNGADRKIIDSFLLSPIGLLPADTKAAGTVYDSTHHLMPLPIEGTVDNQLILLEAEPLAKDMIPDPLMISYGGTIINNTGERVVTADKSVTVFSKGWANTAITLQYKLDTQAKPGRYQIWTAFTNGGKSTQSLIIRAGKDTQHLTERMKFSQPNADSWKTMWQKSAGMLTLLPGEQVVEVEIKGMSADQKIIDAFLLSPAEIFPQKITAESTRLRLLLPSLPQGTIAKQYVYILDNPESEKSEVMLKGLISDKLHNFWLTTQSVYLWGSKSKEMAKLLHINQLPAVVLTDDRYIVTGTIVEPKTEDDVIRLLLSGKGELPALPTVEKPTANPLNVGKPSEWLVAGCWAGPAGLSLDGLDNECYIRPNPDDQVVVQKFDSVFDSQWKPVKVASTGVCIIDQQTGEYVWSRGTAYAHLYIHADNDTTVWLRLKQTGIKTLGWLDGKPLAFVTDAEPPTEFSATKDIVGNQPVTVEGKTDQGNIFAIQVAAGQDPQKTELELKPGWHQLLVKLVMQHKKDDTFGFASLFTGADGKSANGITTQLQDLEINKILHEQAQSIEPMIYTNSSANLPQTTDKIKLQVNLRYNKEKLNETNVVIPFVPFQGKLNIRVLDYNGKEVIQKTLKGLFPTELTIDFDKTFDVGYYAVKTAIYDEKDNLVRVLPLDGFSVIRGSIAQTERKSQKKMSTTYYFFGTEKNPLFVNGNRADTFTWMKKMGIFRNVGSTPGFNKELWEEVKKNELMFTVDFWDYHSSESNEYKKQLAKDAGQYTSWFKSFNEIDIVSQRPTPEKWVERTKWEYEAVKAVNPEYTYIGGSLVRVSKNDWFERCLQLGLDKYQDAWDVHAYPQTPPTLDASLSNSPDETELGVINTYKKIGRVNLKPFWVGETGARSSHGIDARRWQAEAVTKMTAWANARTDVPIISFLIPWTSNRHNASGGFGDIQTGHMPAEAAYYTVSALIDGMPYRRIYPPDPQMQAAYFGETLLVWSTGATKEWQLRLTQPGPWLLVDVVGRITPLPVDADGIANITVSNSPVYVIRQENYDKFTR